MANTNFQNNNGILIIDHTKISTPTNILIKGTNHAPKRKNLLCKDFFNGILLSETRPIYNASVSYNSTSDQLKRNYGPILVFNNGGLKSNHIDQVITFYNLKEYLTPHNEDKKYTLTFKLNKVSNLKQKVNLTFFSDTVNMEISNGMTGIFSVTGIINNVDFNSYNYKRLLRVQLVDIALEEDKEAIVELELLSLELGEHIDDPLLYMPEYFSSNGIISEVEETPLISNNNLTTLGDYQVEGEVLLFLKKIEEDIENMYDFFKPSKMELNLNQTFIRR